MDISTISNNTFVNHVSNVTSNKQLHQVNQVDDANFAVTLKSAQNVGLNAKRTIEQNTGSKNGKGVGKDDVGGGLNSKFKEKNASLDIFV